MRGEADFECCRHVLGDADVTSRSLSTGAAGPTGPPGPTTADQLPWIIDIDPIAGFTSSVATTTTRTADSACFGGGHVDLVHATLTCSATWHTVLSAATWDLVVEYTQDTDSGVITVKYDGATISTVDASGALTRNQRATFAIVVASTAAADLVLSIPATKVMKLQKLQLIRRP